MNADGGLVANLVVVRTANIDDRDGDLVWLYFGAASASDEKSQVVCDLVSEAQTTSGRML